MRIRTIAIHEYLTNIKRKEFILITLGLPLLFLVIGGIGALGAGAAIRQLMREGSEKVGIVDHSHALSIAPEGETNSGFKVLPLTNEEQGRSLITNGKLVALVVVQPDYLDTGRVQVYRKSGSVLGKEERIPVGSILTKALLARSGADKRITQRAIQPTGGGAETYVLEKGRFVPFDAGKVIARFIVPYTFTILLVTAIFISASYLLRGISEEKENRIIEVLLSSVSADELLTGKLIGLAGVGLTQVGIWAMLGAIPAMITYSRLVQITPATLIAVIIFFGLGFGLYAALMAGIGALGTSYRETQQISGMVSMVAFIPLMLITAIIEMPNGAIARVLSYIPFTAPTTMVLRLTTTDVPLPEVLLSAAVVVAGIWLVLKLASRLFRFGILIYGKRPSFAETMRWLRESSA